MTAHVRHAKPRDAGHCLRQIKIKKEVVLSVVKAGVDFRGTIMPASGDRTLHALSADGRGNRAGDGLYTPAGAAAAELTITLLRRRRDGRCAASWITSAANHLP
jgi:hypothetical protein